MKLRNKKTGEILITDGIILPEQNQTNYNSLAELNEEWEDYEDFSATPPDFEGWKEGLIELDCGLKFAPEDFTLRRKDGKVQRFFTWDEAKEIEKKYLLPNGFRLPTLADWTAAYCECGQKKTGEDDPAKFEATLRLSKNGHTWGEDMEDYLEDLDEGRVVDQGSAGLFWSSTPSGESTAYYLDYWSTGVDPQGNYAKGNGFSVRCVAVEEGSTKW